MMIKIPGAFDFCEGGRTPCALWLDPSQVLEIKERGDYTHLVRREGSSTVWNYTERPAVEIAALCGAGCTNDAAAINDALLAALEGLLAWSDSLTCPPADARPHPSHDAARAAIAAAKGE